MQQELTDTVNDAANAPEFHQMADGMKKAIGDFKSVPDSDLFSSVTSYLTTISDACISGWNTASRFARRHPVETSIAVGCVGLLCAYLMMPSRKVKASNRRG